MKRKSYIQFKIPKVELKTQEENKFKLNFNKALTGFLSTFIPKANPDFDDKIKLVEKWIVEFDNKTGIPEREIGMDKNGRIIVKMPFGNNYGYWTDNNLLLADFKNHFETTEIRQESFENYWSSFNKTADIKT
ncbi:hypothetical protein ACFQHQ_13405 [Zunongwangia atlantica 22II14-10F7]|uniref:hypothetical protein n=1 Tax=Zunongwangia atlantica TaxID=1502297 RepID=UPI00111C30FB